MAARNQLLGMAVKDPRLTRVRPSGLEDVTQYRVDVDWEKAGALGVPISDIHDTISSAFGSAYVNDFIQGGRVKRVYVQADAPYRMLPKDLERLYVRNAPGTMTPFSAFATGHWFYGPPLLERFNSFPAMNIWGEPAPGRSSGEAMQAMEEMAAKLPKGIGFDWAGISSRNGWPIPGARALCLLHSRHFLVRGGVVSKLDHSRCQSADVAPEFIWRYLGHVAARLAQRCILPDRNSHHPGAIHQKRHTDYSVCPGASGPGEGLVQATLGATRTRFRPVIMTSLAFFFGVLPLAITTGAGATKTPSAPRWWAA